MELNVVDFMAARSSRRQNTTRSERHRFSKGVRALWRRMKGIPEDVELLAEGLDLTEAPAGHPLKIVQIIGGCQRMRRLLEIGIYPGAQIKVAGAGRHGPVIVKLGETRLAIGRNLARSVMVELVLPA